MFTRPKLPFCIKNSLHTLRARHPPTPKLNYFLCKSKSVAAPCSNSSRSVTASRWTMSFSIRPTPTEGAVLPIGAVVVCLTDGHAVGRHGVRVDNCGNTNNCYVFPSVPRCPLSVQQQCNYTCLPILVKFARPLEYSRTGNKSNLMGRGLNRTEQRFVVLHHIIKPRSIVSIFIGEHSQSLWYKDSLPFFLSTHPLFRAANGQGAGIVSSG